MSKDITQNDITALQDEIGKGLRTFKVFENAEKTLATLAGLGQYESELTGRIAALEEKQATEQAFLDDLVTRTNEANAKAESIVADAKLEAGRLIDEAKGDAEGIIEAAKKAAESNTAEATRLDGVIAERKVELADLENKVAETEKSLEAFRAKAQAI